jgi:hypothetical protein
MHKIFWLENMKGRDNSENLNVDGSLILEWILGKQGGKVGSECIWIRTGTSGGLL